jgi:hypothetical protein
MRTVDKELTAGPLVRGPVGESGSGNLACGFLTPRAQAGPPSIGGPAGPGIRLGGTCDCPNPVATQRSAGMAPDSPDECPHRSHGSRTPRCYLRGRRCPPDTGVPGRAQLPHPGAQKPSRTCRRDTPARVPATLRQLCVNSVATVQGASRATRAAPIATISIGRRRRPKRCSVRIIGMRATLRQLLVNSAARVERDIHGGGQRRKA